MSALAEALVAAQARAVTALGKQYVNNTIGRDEVEIALIAVGLADEVDRDRWLNALDVIRNAGASLPAEPKPSQNGPDRSKATDAQLSLMGRIASERNFQMPDDANLLSRDHASQIIDQMKSGEYDYSTWRVPI